MEPPRIPRFRALVLEDHDFQRRVAVGVLKRCGADVVTEADSGPAAIAALVAEADRLDILLCDLSMPGMDGLEFLRHVAERGSGVSVILASGLDLAIIRSAETMARSYGVRMVGAIEKPITQQKLLPLVLRHFGQSLVPPRARIEAMPVAEVRAALERGEFEPYYQPKVDIRSCALIGAEVLMRWRHPTLGIVPPSAFIPAMEANGLISRATFTLLQAALGDSRAWLDMGLQVPIAVNMAVDSLRDTSLPDRVGALVETAGLDPGYLTIEVTETTAMTDLGHSLETLTRLRMKGFGLSIDDYGTGFSSMQQLTRIPFSELKIDQSFVTGAAQQGVLQALLETSVTMARRLNLKSVAEGIETTDDWDVAARLGCDVAQGFLVAQPMPAAALPAWHDRWLGAHANRPLGAVKP